MITENMDAAGSEQNSLGLWQSLHCPPLCRVNGVNMKEIIWKGSADHWCPPNLMLRTPPDSICLLEPRVEILRAKPRLPDVPPRYLKKRLDL